MSHKKLLGAMLGGLTPAQFLRRHWQKKPLLIRGAFVPGSAPGFEPLTKQEVLTLASREEAESRLIAQDGRHWSLQPGPIGKRERAAVKHLPWTILVQDVQHFSREAHTLLQHFDFIPRARVDDLMVSYAVPGGGVGPHLDSYDVFLLQGMGRRRWRISSQPDTRMRADTPVKILSHFKAEQEWVLEPGDMLYLPPGVAHEGVAESECLTWSIGFRAPTAAELSAAFLDFLRDEVIATGEFSDPDLQPAKHPARIDRKLSKRFLSLLKHPAKAVRDPGLQQRFLGCYLTEPKPQVFFAPPDRPLKAAAFQKQAARRGLELDTCSRLLYDDQALYLNGAVLRERKRGKLPKMLLALAETRALSTAQVSAGEADSDAQAALFQAYCAGFLHLAN